MVESKWWRANGGQGWIRTSVRLRGQIYSLLPLTTRPPVHTIARESAKERFSKNAQSSIGTDQNNRWSRLPRGALWRSEPCLSMGLLAQGPHSLRIRGTNGQK